MLQALLSKFFPSQKNQPIEHIQEQLPPIIQKAKQTLPIKAIVVDDMDHFRETLVEYMEKTGNIIVVKNKPNLDDIVENIKGLHPQLVLLDIIISNTENGTEAVETLKPQFPEICFINMSSEKFFANDAYRVGADAFIYKDDGHKRMVELIVQALDAKFEIDWPAHRENEF